MSGIVGGIPIHIGLFGHVNHGKTALAAQLTEKASTAALDKHPEAQRRGMTIDLGFSAFRLGQYLVTLVDAPGHADLIRSVVAGVPIIDAAILVVAADEGPKIQTGEHVVILDGLGIHKVVVALSKSDLAEPSTIGVVRRSTERILEGTKLQGSPIISINSIGGEGISEIKRSLLGVLEPPGRDRNGPLKMPIDHAFPLSGIGTVVTGTILRGGVRVGDSIDVQPVSKKVRVRSIQTFGEPCQVAWAGDRVGLGLADFSPKEAYRGCVLCATGSLKPSRSLVIRLSVSAHYRGVVRPKTRFHVGVGTDVVSASFLPYETEEQKEWRIRDEVAPGETCNAYVNFSRPTIAERGEKVLVLRLDLPPTTLRVVGVGEVLNPSPTAVEVRGRRLREKTEPKLLIPTHSGPPRKPVALARRREKKIKRLRTKYF